MYSRSPEVQRTIARTLPQSWETVSEKTPGYCYLALFRHDERNAIARMVGPYPHWGDLKTIGNFLRRTYTARRRDGIIHLTTGGIGRYPNGLNLRDSDILGSIDSNVTFKTKIVAPLLGLGNFIMFVFILLIDKSKLYPYLTTWLDNGDFQLLICLSIALTIYAIKSRRVKLISTCLILCAIPYFQGCDGAVNSYPGNNHFILERAQNKVVSNEPPVKMPGKDEKNNINLPVIEPVTNSGESKINVKKNGASDAKSENLNNNYENDEFNGSDCFKEIDIKYYGINTVANCCGDFQGNIDKLRSHMLISDDDACIVNFVYETHIPCYDGNYVSCCNNKTAIAIIEHFSGKLWYDDYVSYMCEGKSLTHDGPEIKDPKTTGQWIDKMVSWGKSTVKDTYVKSMTSKDDAKLALTKFSKSAGDRLVELNIPDKLNTIKTSEKFNEFKTEFGDLWDKQSTKLINSPRRVIEKVENTASIIYEDIDNLAGELRSGAKATLTLGKDVVGSVGNVAGDSVEVIETHFSKQRVTMDEDGMKREGPRPEGLVGLFKHFIGEINHETAEEAVRFANTLVFEPITNVTRRIIVLETDQIYHILNSITSGIGLTSKSDLETGETKYEASITSRVMDHKLSTNSQWLGMCVALGVALISGVTVMTCVFKK